MTRWKKAKKRKGKLKEAVLEADVVKAIRDLLRATGVFHWKFSPGPFGNQEGISDILGVYKVKVADLVAAGVEEVGIFLAIEVKRPGKKPTDAQDRFIENIRDGAGIAFPADCVEDVVEGMKLKTRIEVKRKGGSR